MLNDSDSPAGCAERAGVVLTLRIREMQAQRQFRTSQGKRETRLTFLFMPPASLKAKIRPTEETGQHMPPCLCSLV